MPWEADRPGSDPESRDELIVKHMRLVHHVARQVMRTTSADVQLEELVSAGTLGLMKAIDNFDPSRDLAFSTYAMPRIRGSVLDDLRKRDHATRSIRRNQRAVARAREQLEAELGRSPSHEEVAASLDIDVETLWRWERDAEHATPVSMEGDGGSGTASRGAVRDLLVGDDGREIEDRITRREEVALLRDEILELGERERLVLSLYYFEELKLHEIASLLGVTESRISQIRSAAIGRLRRRLARLREC